MHNRAYRIIQHSSSVLILLCFVVSADTITVSKGTPRLADSSVVYIQEILHSKIPVMIDFWAEWCGPCRILSPLIDEIKESYKGKIKVFKVNVDRNAQLANSFGIQGIPAICILNNKLLVEKITGVQPKEVYCNAIDTLLNSRKE